MAEIVLTRPTGYKSDRLRAYQVYLDGQKAAQIKPGETETFDVSPGQHELRLKIDWGASRSLRVDLGENDRAEFVCGPRVKENDITVMAGLRQACWSTFGCRRYIDLRQGHALAEPKSWTHGLSGPKLFGIALFIAIAWWAVTGQSIAVMGVVVAAMAGVVGALVGRGVGKATVRATEEVQKRRRNE